jgi:hypothetical protein
LKTGRASVFFNYLRSHYDYTLGKSKTAFPTRFHYIEVLKEEFARRNVSISYLGQHCVVLKRESTKEKLVVVVRYTTNKDLELLKDIKQKGRVRVAFLIDDDYWEMIEDERLFPDYRARLERFLTEYYGRLLPLLDAVVAPSEQILNHFPTLLGVKMQPAHMSPSRNLCHFDNAETVRLVFLGTSTHNSDLKHVLPGIIGALEKYKHLHFTTLLGSRGKSFIPAGSQVTHLEGMFFPRFQRWIVSQRFHVGLAPYEPNPVNNGRSNLKFHQHALVGAAGLYSRTKPFLECVDNGVDGLLLDLDPCTWADCISTFVEDWGRTKLLVKQSIEKTYALQTHSAMSALWCSLL